MNILRNSKNSSNKINNNFDNIFIIRVMLIIHAPQTIKWEIALLRYFFFLIFSKKQNFQFPNTKPFTAINFALKIIRKLDWQDWMSNEW